MLRSASIRSQLLTLFGLAVLPAVALSAGLTWHVYQSLKTSAANDHIRAVAHVAHLVRAALTDADAQASTLLVSARRDGEAQFCSSLPDFQRASRLGLAFGFYKGGRLVCAAGDAAALAGFAAPSPNGASADKATEAGASGGETILASTASPHYLGVATFGGAAGSLVTVIAPDYLRTVLERAGLSKNGPFVIVNSQFHIIASSRPTQPPDPHAAPVDPGSGAARALTGGSSFDKKKYAYIASPIEPGVAALLAVKPARGFDEAEQQLVISLVAPLLIFAIVMAVAWLAIDQLFLRWMRLLSRTARRMSYGDFSVRAQLPAVAPRELQQYANAFDQMTEVLGARTRELATVANQRSELLKELHHRVKNNFQVIASFLNLTKRHKHGETYEVLALSECRVHAMAAAYKLALAHGDIRMAPLTMLVNEVVSHVQHAAGGPGGVLINFGAGDIRDERPEEQYLELDRAIPLALLLVEVAWPLLEGGIGGDHRAKLDYLPEEGTVTLVVSATHCDQAKASPDLHNRKMSQRLCRAFIMQLDGHELDANELEAIREGRDDGGQIVLAIRLPVHNDDGIH